MTRTTRHTPWPRPRQPIPYQAMFLGFVLGTGIVIILAGLFFAVWR